MTAQSRLLAKRAASLPAQSRRRMRKISKKAISRAWSNQLKLQRARKAADSDTPKTPVSPLVSPVSLVNGLLAYQVEMHHWDMDWKVQSAVFPEHLRTRSMRSDEGLKQVLKFVTNDKIPKYLFRVFHPNTAINAQRIHYHSTSRIAPSGFRAPNRGHASIFDLTLDEFLAMFHAHVRGDEQVGTEFTSWTPSLSMAISYAACKPDLNYVAVIDTEKVCKTNAAIHVPIVSGGSFQEEYLIHGIITDRRSRDEKAQNPHEVPYVVVPFRELLTRGLNNWFPTLQGLKRARPEEGAGLFAAFAPILMQKDVRQISVEEVKSYRHVAAAFGKGFSVFITVALVTLTYRRKEGGALGWSETSHISNEDVDIILRGMGRGAFKQLDWSGSNGVLHGVYDNLWPDLKQLVPLLECLYRRVWGKGARLTRKRWAIGGDMMTPTTPSKW